MLNIYKYVQGESEYRALQVLSACELRECIRLNLLHCKVQFCLWKVLLSLHCLWLSINTHLIYCMVPIYSARLWVSSVQYTTIVHPGNTLNCPYSMQRHIKQSSYATRVFERTRTFVAKLHWIRWFCILTMQLLLQ